MALDHLDLINDKIIHKVLDKHKSTKDLEKLSSTFGFNEPKATKAIATKIKSLVNSINEIDARPHLRSQSEDVGWHAFLIGYELGKATHAYDLEGIR